MIDEALPPLLRIDLELLAIAAVMTTVTVVIHGMGMVLALVRFERAWHRVQNDLRLWVGQWVMIRLVGLMLAVHLLLAAAWAVAFIVVGAFGDFESALYFSISSYTTIGYGDVTLSPKWRMLGPIEGTLGLLMFGWSTGVLVTIAMRLYQRRFRGDGRAPSGETTTRS